MFTNINTKRGFTLIEILITIAIMGALAGIVVNAVNQTREKAKIAATKLELKSLVNAIAELSIDTGYWPGREPSKGTPNPQTAYELSCGGVSNNEVEDLGSTQGGLTIYHSSYGSDWDGPYIQEVPVDPWGNKYFFDTDYSISDTTEAAAVGSYGPNGVGNNLYDSDDIYLILIKRDDC